jgi:hypothetical protein
MTTVRSEAYVAPDLFHGGDAMGTYPGLTEHVVMSRTPALFMTVLAPRGSSKPEWRARSEDPSRKGVAEALNDNEHEGVNP